MCKNLEGQVSLCDLGIWSGKMSLEPCQAESQKEQTSKQSLKKSSKSSAKKFPLFLSLKKDGLKPDASAEWVTAAAPFPSLGDFTMHSFGESPREENASRLSQILEDCPHQKYCLSARACEGILRRAEKRGKELPKELREALEYQSAKNGDQKKVICKSCGEIFTSDDEIGGLAPAECPRCGEENDLGYLCNAKEEAGEATDNVTSFDPTLHMGGGFFENTASAIVNGTCPGHHNAICHPQN